MSDLSNQTPRIDPKKLKVPGSRPLHTEPHPISTDEEASSAAQQPPAPVGEPKALQSPTQSLKPAAKNPLRKHSLQGMADELECKAADTKPLLGPFVMQGQATMIYAAPNTGKTLIVLKLCLAAIEDMKIDPSNLYYVNADDSSKGLAEKVRLFDEVGANMLAPGFKDFRTDQLVGLLTQMIEEGSARGTCVIIDTLKKFTDLMDKKRSSEFAQVCRRYVMAAGTIVALGHTAKNPNADGTPRYQGTTDILEDFDAVYVGQPMTSKTDADVKGAKFDRVKCRADSPGTVAYAYAGTKGISYAQKLASVMLVDDLGDYVTDIDEVGDPAVMDAIVRRLKAGCADGQMELARAVAKECGISQRAALGILEKYRGDTPNVHLWNFDIGPRGKRCFRLIDQGKPASE